MASPSDDTETALDTAIRAAITRLVEVDQYLLDTTERVVTGRLMIYLEETLSDWLVGGRSLDVDYERAGTQVKRLTDRKIIPDLILHHRGINDATSNFLALEVKVRQDDQALLDHDCAKLRVLKGADPYALPHPTRRLLIPAPRPLPAVEPANAVRLPANVHPYLHAAMVTITRDHQEVDWIH